MSTRKMALMRFIVPTIFFALYLTNVLAAKIQMLMGSNSPVHIGDVGEFLLLLATSITFVFAALNAEKESVDGQVEKN